MVPIHGKSSTPKTILHEVSCGKFEKIAYAFVDLTKKAANSSNKKKSHVGREQYIRKVGCGTWDGQTKRTEIRDCDDNLIGERRMLVFEINELSDKEVDLSLVGHWRMHEYHLCGVNKDIPNLSNTVLCKIILDHSKKPAIKLLPNKTTCPIKASAPEKNETKKTNTKKLDVVVGSLSSTNSAVVDTLEGISKSWGDFTTICHNDGLVSGPRGEEERCCDDDDMEDWINNLFVSEEGEEGNLYINMSEFEFPSYSEHEDEQPLVDVTGKRKLQPETSYVDQVRRMLRLSKDEEQNVREFQEMYIEAKKKGFGRLFRSPTLFEDMVKCLLLCNCQAKRIISLARAIVEGRIQLVQLEEACSRPSLSN